MQKSSSGFLNSTSNTLCDGFSAAQMHAAVIFLPRIGSNAKLKFSCSKQAEQHSFVSARILERATLCFVTHFRV